MRAVTYLAPTLFICKINRHMVQWGSTNICEIRYLISTQWMILCFLLRIVQVPIKLFFYIPNYLKICLNYLENCMSTVLNLDFCHQTTVLLSLNNTLSPINHFTSSSFCSYCSFCLIYPTRCLSKTNISVKLCWRLPLRFDLFFFCTHFSISPCIP